MNPLEFINEKLAIAEKATPGPWKHDSCGDVWTESPAIPLDRIEGTDIYRIVASSRTAPDSPDAALIADAGSNYAKVLRALRAVIQELGYIRHLTTTEKPDEMCHTLKVDVPYAVECALAAIERELS